MENRAEIKKAIKEVLNEKISSRNYGMLSRVKASNTAHQCISCNGITFDENFVYQKGKALYRINKKYASVKKNGMYKELMPDLIPMA